MTKKIKLIPLIICIAIPLALGFISGFFTKGSMEVYSSIKTPFFAPPPIAFPIVWSILYVLMGISLYLIYISYGKKLSAYGFFAAQLFVNLTWTPIFFNLKAFTLAFIWLCLLLVLIVMMIRAFYKIKAFAAYLQIPYLLWVFFAGVLNLFTAIMN